MQEAAAILGGSAKASTSRRTRAWGLSSREFDAVNDIDLDLDLVITLIVITLIVITLMVFLLHEAVAKMRACGSSSRFWPRRRGGPDGSQS
jgi:hypothetical protein